MSSKMRHGWKWGLVAAVVVALALGLQTVLIPTPPVGVAAGPVKLATFPDGATLEILGVSVGERVVEVSPGRKFFLPFFTHKGSSGGTYGGLNIDTELEGGQVIRARLRSDSTAAMLMELRLKESSGLAMKLPNYLTQHLMVLKDERFGKETGDRTRFFRPVDDSVQGLLDAMNKVGLQLLIQHRDPQSGWIHLNGPSMYHEPWPDRYIVALTAWQRSLPTLDFRAIRADGQVAEFSLPNPEFRKSPAAGPITALPLVHSGGDYSLTLRQVERFRTPGDHPFSGVEMDFVPRSTRIAGEYGAALTLKGGTAEDEWGNRVSFEQNTIHKKLMFGAGLPASSRRMKIYLTVVRTVNSPRFESTGFNILEGVVSPDGLSVEFTPGTDAARFGIHSMPVGAIKPTTPGWSDPATKDWKLLTFPVTGGNDVSQLPSIENRIGNIFGAQFLIFPEGSDESDGITPWGLDGGGGQGGEKFKFKRDVTWLGAPEMLRPGAKLRVGIHRPANSDELTFDLELPEQVRQR